MGIGTSSAALCLYGHFYQPPREDPFSGLIHDEHDAAPFPNFNEKITAECYQPNAMAGNFEAISFDLGPTLAIWLERAHPDTYARIIAADQWNVARYGVGNALAQVYNHTILPLANHRDRRLQIAWGLADFEHRFGRRADGMWLAETAADLESLALLAELGVRYTVLAPWQAAEPVDTTEPYLVRLPGGRSITVFFYNGPLSGGVSFDWETTSDADLFADAYLRRHLTTEKRLRGESQLILVATDGELYGHHKPWRDRFLSHLVNRGASRAEIEITSLGRYLRDHPPTREVALREPGSWSCHHGVARWSTGCGCTEGDSSWKPALRQALTRLQEQIDSRFVRGTSATLRDPWAARTEYLALRNHWMSAERFWTRHGMRGERPAGSGAERRTTLLLEAQYFSQWMFTSCAFFFDDLDRIEPRNNIAFARRAISLVWQATQNDLQTDFLTDLARAHSWRSGVNGAECYLQLPPVTRGLLPGMQARQTQREPAA
ncbi:MAG TPA: DUF3536 domain-containing protein [Ktedonobacterales bacterium]|nr:DUF3536 domain-containing protein [Ktedonobacterales bacterium]